MPKETVQTADGQVSVGWQRERDVQVGVVLRSADYTEARTSSTAISTPPPQTWSTASAAERLDGGQWVTLNRDGLNRLIRALRKARDAAFGADA